MKRYCPLVLVVMFVMIGGLAEGQELQSRRAAGELTALLHQQRLSAVAAKDPSAPDRYVAALFFPDVQLLVVSARYPEPALLQQQLDQKQYQEVYTALQGAGIPDSKLFVQDLKADGLHAKPADAVDIVYEHVTAQTIFDGNPGSHKMTEKAYNEKLATTDAEYGRVLALLVDAVKGASVARRQE
jgi:hypothetical protein